MVKTHCQILMTKFLLICVTWSSSKPTETWKQWPVDGKYALQFKLDTKPTENFLNLVTSVSVHFYLC